MSRNATFAAAGLQAGMAGALSLLLWLSLASRFFGKSVWWTANLLASAFYGDASLKFGFGPHTLAGFALVLFAYGLIGIFFGLLRRDGVEGSTTLGAALAMAVLAYYVLLKWAFHQASPEAALYSPDRQILFGHLVFAFFLARYPKFRDRLRS